MIFLGRKPQTSMIPTVQYNHTVWYHIMAISPDISLDVVVKLIQREATHSTLICTLAKDIHSSLVSQLFWFSVQLQIRNFLLLIHVIFLQCKCRWETHTYHIKKSNGAQQFILLLINNYCTKKWQYTMFSAFHFIQINIHNVTVLESTLDTINGTQRKSMVCTLYSHYAKGQIHVYLAVFKYYFWIFVILRFEIAYILKKKVIGIW